MEMQHHSAFAVLQHQMSLTIIGSMSGSLCSLIGMALNKTYEMYIRLLNQAIATTLLAPWVTLPTQLLIPFSTCLHICLHICCISTYLLTYELGDLSIATTFPILSSLLRNIGFVCWHCARKVAKWPNMSSCDQFFTAKSLWLVAHHTMVLFWGCRVHYCWCFVFPNWISNSHCGVWYNSAGIIQTTYQAMTLLMPRQAIY